MSQFTSINRLNPIVLPLPSSESQETSGVLASNRDGLLPTAVVWKNFEITQWESYIQLQYENRRNSDIKNPPPEPATFKRFIDGRLCVLENEIEKLKSAIAAKEKKPDIGMKDKAEIMSAFGGKNLEEGTMVIIRTIPPVTEAEILASRVANRKLDTDPEFVRTAEYRVGKSLLEML